MMTKFLENFYGALFCPDKTFSNIKEETPIGQALGLVVIISILSILITSSSYFRATGILGMGYQVIFAAIAGIISWLFFAFFLELIATVFGQNGKMKPLLSLTAFALIPWIFLAPIELLKNTGDYGNLAAILFGLTVWLWVTILEMVAVMKTYELTFGRAFLMLIIPFLGGFLSFHWFVGFFSTLGNIVRL